MERTMGKKGKIFKEQQNGKPRINSKKEKNTKFYVF